jgi:hypothetical protein
MCGSKREEEEWRKLHEEIQNFYRLPFTVRAVK